MTLRLIIGNKNYSSWSMRPWLAMTVARIPFEEELISLDAPEFKTRMAAIGGNGKVPVLIDGAVHIWESLAILEHLAERFPQSALWPADPAARGHARALAAEMHAGFAALRREAPMNLWRPVEGRALSDEALANVRRVEALWTDCRRRFGAGGDFLCGTFGAVDAMYAPVVSRLHTYAIEVGPAARDYMAAIMALPAWQEWRQAALAEPWVRPNSEVDWPTVRRMKV